MPFILNIYRITSYTPILSPKEHINVIYFYFLLLIHSFLFHILNYHCVNESHSLDIFRITSFTWISHDHSKSRFYLFLIVSFTKRSAIHNDWIVIFIIFKRLPSLFSIFHHFSLFKIHLRQILPIKHETFLFFAIYQLFEVFTQYNIWTCLFEITNK